MANTVKTVQIVVDAKDQASSVLKGIGGALQTAIGTFAGGAALKLATKGFEKLTDVIGDCFQESRDAAKGMAQTRTVIKSTGKAANVSADDVADLAGSLSHLTLFSDDAIQAQENLILTFTNVRNEVGEGNDIFTQATKIGLDMAQALGTDAAGSAIQLGKALNDPIKGIAALSRVGVTFTDQQKLQIETMIDAGNTMGAQKVILAELSKEFGGSAEAAARADGGFHLLQQRLSDVKQEIGDALMPVLSDLMGWLTGPGLDAVERWGKSIATWITDTAVPAFTLGMKTIQDTIDAFKTGDLSKLNFDAIALFGPDKGQLVIDTLQKIRAGWGLARDSVITFKEAYQGSWKDADTILPLHQAFGLLGESSRTTIDWLTQTGLPAIKKGWPDAILPFIPAINQLADAFKNRLGPDSNATLMGLTADMRETRDVTGITLDDMHDAFEKFYQFQHKQGLLFQEDWDTLAAYLNEQWLPKIKIPFETFDRWLTTWVQTVLEPLIARILKALFVGKSAIASVPGGGLTPGGNAVIGPQVSGPSVRDGISATLPSGYRAGRVPSVSPDRGGRSTRPALTVDLRGASFGAGLTEGQVRGWIAPVLDDALRRWESGLLRETTDLATRGALR